ncbi:hypothetical protein A2230_04620 [candidate division WOR-1 bacterium RIFOXYA2_FULL_36_21]|uniref:Type II secretion system protein GspI C-terminal domain-containing protein n=1 Tax=candidate division WOR-1 bacterium RIFOXYB2_FULL_36_35 TaxID=1802578 RepID=A0A1F4S2T0_UNCSA|nr:MAG: hypothetical protein A2230_04620 [candidate division WOR-1 bacterium RIFOXYA2_FULL_36_21]OGC14677.1 MAG: hypothetical protein A2290_01350 [candidate division WOR-1 bacterium RIFOXYB2_FULL_36_35]OGC19695.1 MAG: hypothetical protein A2282_03075 [candidate division WOR-1 bacterium RIFOXYA12_FULL_36_13]
MRNKTSLHGFTLIELLLSALILTLIAGSFSLLFSRSAKLTGSDQEFLTALNVVKSQAEEIRSKNFSKINPYDFDNKKGKVEVIYIYQDLIQLKFSYNWKKNKPPMEIYTMRSKY